jgi:predicted protein tyrosine phosphatase
MECLVYSRKEVETALAPSVPYIVISITTSPSDRARVPQSSQCLGVLRLAFFDVDVPVQEAEPDGLFSVKDAQQIWDFVLPKLSQLRCIMVHCRAGKSRSPAVAAALISVLCGDALDFFERYQPNTRVYRMLREVYHTTYASTSPTIPLPIPVAANKSR